MLICYLLMSHEGESFYRMAWKVAEAVRFELTKGCPLPVFKTGAFNHSATLPCVLVISLVSISRYARQVNLLSEGKKHGSSTF